MDNNNSNNQKKRQKYPEATPFPCSINSFKKLGWEVEVTHFRRHECEIDNYGNLVNQITLPNGGSTVVRIMKEGQKLPFKGVSACNKKDNFNKKIGITKALGRAFSQYLKAKYPNLRVKN